MSDKEEKEEEGGRLIITPHGFFKTPCDHDCLVAAAVHITAEKAIELLAPADPRGLDFLASIHLAHYKSCEDCKRANPKPEPRLTPGEEATVRKIYADAEKEAEALAPAVSELLQALMAGATPPSPSAQDKKRRSIGFGGGMVN